VSTRDFSWGKGGRCFWLTTYHPCSAETSRKSGALTYPEPLGPPRPVAGDLYFFYYYYYHTSQHVQFNNFSFWFSYSFLRVYSKSKGYRVNSHPFETVRRKCNIFELQYKVLKNRPSTREILLLLLLLLLLYYCCCCYCCCCGCL